MQVSSGLEQLDETPLVSYEDTIWTPQRSAGFYYPHKIYSPPYSYLASLFPGVT
jgi:hypothetical protein